MFNKSLPVFLKYLDKETWDKLPFVSKKTNKIINDLLTKSRGIISKLANAYNRPYSKKRYDTVDLFSLFLEENKISLQSSIERINWTSQNIADGYENASRTYREYIVKFSGLSLCRRNEVSKETWRKTLKVQQNVQKFTRYTSNIFGPLCVICLLCGYLFRSKKFYYLGCFFMFIFFITKIGAGGIKNAYSEARRIIAAKSRNQNNIFERLVIKIKEVVDNTQLYPHVKQSEKKRFVINKVHENLSNYVDYHIACLLRNIDSKFKREVSQFLKLISKNDYNVHKTIVNNDDGIPEIILLIEYYIKTKKLNTILPNLDQRFIALCVYFEIYSELIGFDNIRFSGKKAKNAAYVKIRKQFNQFFKTIKLNLNQDNHYILFIQRELLSIKMRINKYYKLTNMELCRRVSYIKNLKKNIQEIKKSLLTKRTTLEYQSTYTYLLNEINRYETILDKELKRLDMPLKGKNIPSPKPSHFFFKESSEPEGGFKVPNAKLYEKSYSKHFFKEIKECIPTEKKNFITWVENGKEQKVSSTHKNIVLVYDRTKKHIMFCAYIEKDKYTEFYNVAKEHDYVALGGPGFKKLKKVIPEQWELKDPRKDEIKNSRLYADTTHSMEVMLNRKKIPMHFFSRIGPAVHKKKSL